MSNVLRDQCVWFPVPRALIDAGYLGQLSGAATKLYLVLMSLAQRHSAVQLELPAYKVQDFAKLNAETVVHARRELEEVGLVTCNKGAYGVTSYVLLNPGTQVPLPPTEGRSTTLRHYPTPGRSARTARKHLKVKPTESTKTVAPQWDEIGKSESTTRKIREHATEISLPSGFEIHESASVNARPRSLKQSLKKGFSEKREKASGEKGKSVSSENKRVEEGDPDLRFLICYKCSEKKRVPVWYRRPNGEYFCGVCFSAKM